ncbi:MAG TPA: PAS domain S-box protein, partial [Candidatus Angelobacter sp.]
NSAIDPRTRLHSPEVFRLLVETSADYAIFLLDPDGIITSWNAGAERLKLYKAEEIIGKHFSVLYIARDLAMDKPGHALRVAAEIGRFEDAGWRVRKDGSCFWADVVITRILDENGSVIGFGKITRDVTERRQADLHLRLLVESVLDYAIFSMDTEGHITSWNIGGQRIKGYKPEEVLGKHFSLFYTEEDRTAGLPQRILQTAAEQGHFEGEGWRVRKDGTRFWASIVVTALRDEEGSLSGFSKVTRDMSDRKALLEELKRHAEELELRVKEREQSNAELEAFAYSVSHDLRAPLRAIVGFAEALQEDCAKGLDQQGLEYLDEIIKAAGRMNLLVQDLLEYGRVSRISLQLAPVNLREAVDNAIRQLGNDHGGTLEVQVASDLWVRAHPQALTQVVFNLLSNAVKFHKQGLPPEVQLRTEAGNGSARLAVIDNGIGIAPQHHERIWQVFERLHDRETYAGTGIGLAIVKRAVNRMGGRCGLESEAGKGSTFWIELPLADAEKEKINRHV